MPILKYLLEKNKLYTKWGQLMTIVNIKKKK